MSTAASTVPAATRPIAARKPMPVTVRAASAMKTVRPAKVTALPAVPIASASESTTPMPRRSWVR